MANLFKSGEISMCWTDLRGGIVVDRVLIASDVHNGAERSGRLFAVYINVAVYKDGKRQGRSAR